MIDLLLRSKAASAVVIQRGWLSGNLSYRGSGLLYRIAIGLIILVPIPAWGESSSSESTYRSTREPVGIASIDRTHRTRIRLGAEDRWFSPNFFGLIPVPGVSGFDYVGFWYACWPPRDFVPDPDDAKAWDTLQSRMIQAIPDYRDEVHRVSARALSSELTAREAGLNYQRMAGILQDVDQFIKGSMERPRLLNRKDLFDLRKEARKIKELGETVQPVLLAKASGPRVLVKARTLVATVADLERRRNKIEVFWESLPEGPFSVRTILENVQGLEPTATRDLVAGIEQTLGELKGLVFTTAEIKRTIASLEEHLSLARILADPPKWYAGINRLQEGDWDKVIVSSRNQASAESTAADTPHLLSTSDWPPLDDRRLTDSGKVSGKVKLYDKVPVRVFWKKRPLSLASDLDDEAAFRELGPYFVIKSADGNLTIANLPSNESNDKNRTLVAPAERFISWTGRKICHPAKTKPWTVHVTDVGPRKLSLLIEAPPVDRRGGNIWPVIAEKDGKLVCYVNDHSGGHGLIEIQRNDDIVLSTYYNDYELASIEEAISSSAGITDDLPGFLDTAFNKSPDIDPKTQADITKAGVQKLRDIATNPATDLVDFGVIRSVLDAHRDDVEVANNKEFQERRAQAKKYLFDVYQKVHEFQSYNKEESMDVKIVHILVPDNSRK